MPSAGFLFSRRETRRRRPLGRPRRESGGTESETGTRIGTGTETATVTGRRRRREIGRRRKRGRESVPRRLRERKKSQRGRTAPSELSVSVRNLSILKYVSSLPTRTVV